MDWIGHGYWEEEWLWHSVTVSSMSSTFLQNRLAHFVSLIPFLPDAITFLVPVTSGLPLMWGCNLWLIGNILLCLPSHNLSPTSLLLSHTVSDSAFALFASLSWTFSVQFSYGTMAQLQPIFSCRSSSGTGMLDFSSLQDWAHSVWTPHDSEEPLHHKIEQTLYKKTLLPSAKVHIPLLCLFVCSIGHNAWKRRQLSCVKDWDINAATLFGSLQWQEPCIQ